MEPADMAMTRRIVKTLKSEPTIEGAGVRLKRAFGYHQVPDFDPFLMLDDFHSSDPADYMAGFPWHPHRGIETITYILEGLVEHGDSMGNKGAIGAGEVQWMTAGSGIIHQEMPQKSPTGTMWGFQLWANLPAAHKMTAPRYRGLKAADIPEAGLKGGVRVKVICGEVDGVKGPVRDIIIDPGMFDVTVPETTTFTCPVKDGHTAIAYVIDGEGHFGKRQDISFRDAPDEFFGPESVVLYEREGGHVAVTASKKPVRFLLFTGRPLGEPVAWRGPIVMNTQEELKKAFEEYNNGTFVK